MKRFMAWLVMLAALAVSGYATMIHETVIPKDSSITCPFVPLNWYPIGVEEINGDFVILSTGSSRIAYVRVSVYVLDEFDILPDLAMPIGMAGGKAVLWHQVPVCDSEPSKAH